MPITSINPSLFRKRKPGRGENLQVSKMLKENLRAFIRRQGRSREILRIGAMSINLLGQTERLKKE
jgi:hypothetical protein